MLVARLWTKEVRLFSELSLTVFCARYIIAAQESNITAKLTQKMLQKILYFISGVPKFYQCVSTRWVSEVSARLSVTKLRPKKFFWITVQLYNLSRVQF